MTIPTHSLVTFSHDKNRREDVVAMCMLCKLNNNENDILVPVAQLGSVPIASGDSTDSVLGACVFPRWLPSFSMGASRLQHRRAHVTWSGVCDYYY